MNFIEFKNKFFDLACLSTHQVYAWHPGFDRNNLSGWTNKGLIIRLRQGFYTFPEYKDKAEFILYFANRIYRPSYISLHTALAYYGIIPEAVVQITSVSSLKTISFTNEIGEYIYKSVKKEVLFGYDLKSIADGKAMHIASPEKALLDLLYLYPEYNTVRQLNDLRLDDNYLHDELNKDILKEFVKKFKNKALEKRVQMFFTAYGL